MVGGIKRLCASDVCLSRTSGLSREQREQRPRKTKIGTDVANVIPDSDTTFKVKRSKVILQGAGHIVAASRTACIRPRVAVACHHVHVFGVVCFNSFFSYFADPTD